MMRILQVMAGAEYGGAETAFVDLCLAMHEAGAHIEVVTRPNDLRVAQLKQAGITVHCLPFGGRLDIYTPLALRRIIKRFQPDIVQGWMSRAPFKIPRWSTSMNIPRYVTVARLGSPYKIKYFKTMDYFVALTPDLKTYLMEQDIAEDRITHINNFAEIEPVETALNRADYDTPEDAPLILGLGRLHPDKAFDTLIKVAAQMPDVHVWIAGEGPQRAELEDLIIELNLEQRVKLLGWRTDRAALLQACDVCAFISRNEGFGSVFIQSWAQKTPLVICDSEGPRQFVRDGENGLIALIDDIPAIKAALQRLIDEPDFAKRLTENGFERYQDAFTKAVCVKAYLDYFQRISSR